MAKSPEHPQQPLYYTEDGIIRFKKNAIVRWLLDTHPHADMNVLSVTPFEQEDREQFAQLIGYSQSGFEELSYVSDEACAKAEQQAEKLSLDREAESLERRVERFT